MPGWIVMKIWESVNWIGGQTIESHFGFLIVFPGCIDQLPIDQEAMESHYVNVDSVTL